jgi:hypothetical protein
MHGTHTRRNDSSLAEIDLPDSDVRVEPNADTQLARLGGLQQLDYRLGIESSFSEGRQSRLQ